MNSRRGFIGMLAGLLALPFVGKARADGESPIDISYAGEIARVRLPLTKWEPAGAACSISETPICDDSGTEIIATRISMTITIPHDESFEIWTYERGGREKMTFEACSERATEGRKIFAVPTADGKYSICRTDPTAEGAEHVLETIRRYFTGLFLFR